MTEGPAKDTHVEAPPETGDKAKAEYEKIAVETTKLREEIQRLRSENSPLGRLGRVVWPLVSGALTAVVSFVALNLSWQSGLGPGDLMRERQHNPDCQRGQQCEPGNCERSKAGWHNALRSVPEPHCSPSAHETAVSSEFSVSVMSGRELSAPTRKE